MCNYTSQIRAIWIHCPFHLKSTHNFRILQQQQKITFFRTEIYLIWFLFYHFQDSTWLLNFFVVSDPYPKKENKLNSFSNRNPLLQVKYSQEWYCWFLSHLFFFLTKAFVHEIISLLRFFIYDLSSDLELLELYFMSSFKEELINSISYLFYLQNDIFNCIYPEFTLDSVIMKR